MYRLLIHIHCWHIRMPYFHNEIPIFPSIPHISRLPLSVHVPRNVSPGSPHCYLNIPLPRQFQPFLATSQAQFFSLPVSLTSDSTSKSVYPFLFQLLSLLSLTHVMSSSVLPSNKRRRQRCCRRGSRQVSEQGSLKVNHRQVVLWSWWGWGIKIGAVLNSNRTFRI